MYCTPVQTLKANKIHRCTWCAESIAKSEMYYRWASFGDCCFTNKMHEECLHALYDQDPDWGGEYMAYDNDRPVTQE